MLFILDIGNVIDAVAICTHVTVAVVDVPSTAADMVSVLFLSWFLLGLVLSMLQLLVNL